MINTNQECIRDMQIIKRKESKHNTQESYQTATKERKRNRGGGKKKQTNPHQKTMRKMAIST